MVVGFTAGRRTGPDEVTIRGDDAHAWPEVYLGPTAGWVSFEPTPQKLTGEAAPEGVVGPSGVERTVPPPVTSPPSVPQVSIPTAPTTASPTTPSTAGPNGGANAATRPASPRSSGLLLLLLALGILLVAVLVIVAVIRRRRWSPSGRSTVGLVLLAEAVVERALKEAGVGRPHWQPLSLFVADLSERLEDSSTGPRLGGPIADDALGPLLADVAIVAETVEQALYDFGPMTPESARRAYAAALRVQQGLRGRDLGRTLSSTLAADTPTDP